MRLLRRWLSHSVRLALALFLAVVAMQAPAYTTDYANALLQVSADGRRDIDRREAAARQYYALPESDDAATIAGLRAHEPANADGLALSLDRVGALAATRERILGAPVLVQPIVALADAAHDPDGYKAAIWRALLGTYTVHLDLTFAAILYGFAGLMLGSLIGQLLCAPLDRMETRRAALR